MTAVVFCGPVHTSPLNRVSQNSNSGLINISKSLLSQDKDAEDVGDKDNLNTQKESPGFDIELVRQQHQSGPHKPQVKHDPSPDP
ncbi:hypothetical protein DPMN_020127 [Dreissena polymorpha]|uniref:Uncharacterized protein n=1 Tax=Dreissena polymorpha TaxID=45954 RepID=A0A9D4NJT6_DREPO|nr:hypothetical protein DPMN_020127 [Dreissena polymorpha]